MFGIIKSVLGFRQFSLRGLDKVRGEWSLVTLAWNIKRMFALKAAPSPRSAPSAAIRVLPANSSHHGNSPQSQIDRLTSFFGHRLAVTLRPITLSPTGC